jgi:signal transduction histidine kinase
LGTLLLEQRDALVDQWSARVLADPEVPEAKRLPQPELQDHIPHFIDQLARSLEDPGAQGGVPESGEERGRELGSNGVTVAHARQRIAERYTTSAALRELSHFRAVITDLCFREMVVLDHDSAQLLHAAIDSAMSRAACEIERAGHGALREEVDVRERFMAILGHDLRDPIGGILIAAKMMLGQNLNEPLAGYVHRMTRSAERASNMISAMLDLANARLGGGIPLHKRRADTRDVCQSAIDEAKLRHANRTIDFAPQGNGVGFFDAERMAQAIGNLLSNALAYSPPTSVVRIGTREADAARVVIESTTRGRRSRLARSKHSSIRSGAASRARA